MTDDRVPNDRRTLPASLRQVDGHLSELRADPSRRRIALGGAVVLGLALSWVHWLGLFLAGALVGLTQPSLPRALAGGFGFGVLVVGVFFLLTPLVTPYSVGALAPLSYLTLALGLLGPTWGALLRGAL